MNRPSCSGQCEQGKNPCPCPQSCQQPDSEQNNDLAIACAIVIGVWVVAVAIVPALAGYFLEITK